jgi:hypothetical protein
MANTCYPRGARERAIGIPAAFVREGDVPPPPPDDPHFREWFSTGEPDLSWLKYGVAGTLVFVLLLALLQVAYLTQATLWNVPRSSPDARYRGRGSRPRCGIYGYCVRSARTEAATSAARNGTSS